MCLHRRRIYVSFQRILLNFSIKEFTRVRSLCDLTPMTYFNRVCCQNMLVNITSLHTIWQRIHQQHDPPRLFFFLMDLKQVTPLFFKNTLLWHWLGNLTLSASVSFPSDEREEKPGKNNLKSMLWSALISFNCCVKFLLFYSVRVRISETHPFVSLTPSGLWRGLWHFGW